MRRVLAFSILEAPGTLVQCLCCRALEQPGQIADTFLTYSGEPTSESLLYQELDLWARAMRDNLQSRGVAGKPMLLFVLRVGSILRPPVRGLNCHSRVRTPISTELTRYSRDD